LLGHDRASRIFQDASVEAIVAELLSRHGIPCSWRVSRQLSVREYRVQYRESTLDFLHRLLAEEGVFYFFTHSDSRSTNEVVVFADRAEHYDAISGSCSVPFRDTGGLKADEYIRAFAMCHSVRPHEVVLTGRDFTRPRFDLRGRAERAARVVSPRIHDHHGHLDEREIDDAVAARHLDSHILGVAMARKSSTCRRLGPATWFDLTDHPNTSLDMRYAVVRVEHVGHQRQDANGAPSASSYENNFTCLPSDAVWRPTPPHRALQQVVETATVVGPPGEEIHVDRYGRIKVLFPWDQDDTHVDNGSCWLRTMQPWAGTGWGSQFIPRVGMEVVVTFTGGNVDRPLVLGAVYNGLNLPPFPLPCRSGRHRVAYERARLRARARTTSASRTPRAASRSFSTRSATWTSSSKTTKIAASATTIAWRSADCAP
jgi:type VI secretion system secreted protein VgrG